MKNTIIVATMTMSMAGAAAFAAQAPNDASAAAQTAPAPQTAPATPPAAAPAPAADFPQPPRDHVDTKVVGSSTPADGPAPESAIVDNRHDFQAGAPDMMKVIAKLHLSQRQKTQVRDAIERADAGAGALINRERDVKDMIAATTPENPTYAKLISEQAGEDDRWNENRDGLRRDVMAVLTPAQQARFEELMASR